MTSDTRGPGPAYDFEPPDSNVIVGASYYVVSFVVALIIQRYIENGLSLYTSGVDPATAVLLAAGLVVLLFFALEYYLTATTRSDTLSRGEIPFEVVRASLLLVPLLGLHTFSLALSGASAASAARIASRFGWGLCAVYGAYVAIRLTIVAQNYYLGESPTATSMRATALYLVYAAVWAGYGATVPRAGDWVAGVSFPLLATAALAVYVGYWRTRFEMMLGIDE